MAGNLNYCLYSEGLLPLDTVIAKQGGECGDFTTLYVNLLRNKQIPARHVAAFTGGSEYHVWAEFLLPVYGWVPVDATYKNGNPNGNFFGEYHESYIVSHLGINLSVNSGNGTYQTLTLLQSYAWWYWYDNSECPYMDVERQISYERAQGPLFPTSLISPVPETFTAHVFERRLQIDAPGCHCIKVFDLTGRHTGVIHGGHGTITLPCSGVYIIKPDRYSAKKIICIQ